MKRVLAPDTRPPKQPKKLTRDPVTGEKVLSRPHRLARDTSGLVVQVDTNVKRLPEGWSWFYGDA